MGRKTPWAGNSSSIPPWHLPVEFTGLFLLKIKYFRAGDPREEEKRRVSGKKKKSPQASSIEQLHACLTHRKKKKRNKHREFIPPPKPASPDQTGSPGAWNSLEKKKKGVGAAGRSCFQRAGRQNCSGDLFRQVLGAWKESLTIWIWVSREEISPPASGKGRSRAARQGRRFSASSGCWVWVGIREMQVLHPGRWRREGAAKKSQKNL